MNILIGCVYNSDESKLRTWLNSSNILSFDRRVLLTLNCNLEKISDVEIINYSYSTWSENNILRHKCYLDFLNTVNDNDVILITDVYDVYFQNDAYQWWYKNIGNYELVVTSEGLKFKDEDWNLKSIENNFQEYVDKLINREIINGGILMGYKRTLYELSYFIYSIGRGRNYHNDYGKDQPTLNICLNSEIFTKKTLITTPNDCFGINCASCEPSFNGKKYKSYYLYNQPNLKEDSICNYKGDMYCIVHQYNRIPELEDLIMKRL